MEKYILKFKFPLMTLLLVGFIMRILLIFIDYSWDVNSHITWGKEVIERGISGFYDRPTIDQFSTIYPNYPPLTIYLFTLCYQLYLIIKSVLWQMNILLPAFPSTVVTWFDSREVIAGFMKIPSIIADIGTGYLLYRLVMKYNANRVNAIYAVAFYLFNPVFWYTSALWGQVESIPIFLILLSYYLLLYTDKKYVPLIIFTLALLSKQTSIIFIPVILVAYLKKYSISSLLKSAGVSLALFWLMTIPFYQQGNILLYPFTTYVFRILGVSGIPFASNHAFNFWALITQWRDISDTAQFMSIGYRYWGYCISGMFGVIIYWFSIRRSLSSKNIYFTSLITAFTVYLFFTRMHERHLQQALIFFIPFAIVDKRINMLYIVVSFIHMVNLYHNWSVPRVDAVLQVVLSIITVNILILGLLCVYGYMLYLYVRQTGWIRKSDTV